jgi:hypothetical protein
VKYAAIAALLIANTSAVDIVLGQTCTTVAQCGTTNRCAAVTKIDVSGTYLKMCVAPANCVTASKGV